MKRAKKRYEIRFTNDRGSGCFGTYTKREVAEAKMNSIIREDKYDVSCGYADIHLRCWIEEVTIY